MHEDGGVRSGDSVARCPPVRTNERVPVRWHPLPDEVRQVGGPELVVSNAAAPRWRLLSARMVSVHRKLATSVPSSAASRMALWHAYVRHVHETLGREHGELLLMAVALRPHRGDRHDPLRSEMEASRYKRSIKIALRNGDMRAREMRSSKAFSLAGGSSACSIRGIPQDQPGRAHIWDFYETALAPVSISYAPTGKCALPATAKRLRILTRIKVARVAA